MQNKIIIFLGDYKCQIKKSLILYIKIKLFMKIIFITIDYQSAITDTPVI